MKEYYKLYDQLNIGYYLHLYPLDAQFEDVLND